FAAVAQVVVGEIQESADEASEVLFDAGLILRSRRYNPGFRDRAVRFDPIAVVEKSPRRFGGAEAHAGARLDGDRRPVRLFVNVDNAERLVAGIKHLDGADHDAAIRIGAGSSEPRFARRLLGDGREALEIQAVARE